MESERSGGQGASQDSIIEDRGVSQDPIIEDRSDPGSLRSDPGSLRWIPFFFNPFCHHSTPRESSRHATTTNLHSFASRIFLGEPLKNTKQRIYYLGETGIRDTSLYLDKMGIQNT